MTKRLQHRWRPKTQRDWIVLTVCAIPIVFAALILTLSFTLPMVQLVFFRAVSIVMILATLLLYHALAAPDTCQPMIGDRVQQFRGENK